MLKAFRVTTAFLLSISPLLAETIGGPSLTQRAVVDTAVGSVYIFNANFTITGAQVTSFSFFNNNPSNTNWITPIILVQQSGRTYQVTGVGQSVQNTGAGVQTYAFTLVSGSANIASTGYTFGFWNGRLSTNTGNTGVVQFDGNGAPTDPGFGESCAVANTPPCSFTTVAAGNSITFGNNYNQFPNGGNALASPNGRNYSIQFTSNGVSIPSTPVPSSFWLMLGGLVVLAGLYHKFRGTFRRPDAA
jgi:hypothetical protein